MKEVGPSSRTSGWARRTVAAVLVLAAVAALGGCRPPDRPTAEEWTPTWEAAQAVIPAPEDLDDPPSEGMCQRVLGDLREIRAEMAPAPDELIQTATEAWISYAEHVFFSCFQAVEGDDRVDAAYETLDRLRAEVETAVRTKRDG